VFQDISFSHVSAQKHRMKFPSPLYVPHLSFLHLIMQRILGEECRSPPYFGPNISLSTFFSKSFSLCSSLIVTKQISHQYKTKRKIMALYILIKADPQWPRRLRRGSAAQRLLGSWVRISPGAWMFVSCESYVLSGRGLCDRPIPRPEESYRVWCV
jgi:hypothetical protein